MNLKYLIAPIQVDFGSEGRLVAKKLKIQIFFIIT
jgi:hypothetical protein